MEDEMLDNLFETEEVTSVTSAVSLHNMANEYKECFLWYHEIIEYTQYKLTILYTENYGIAKWTLYNNNDEIVHCNYAFTMPSLTVYDGDDVGVYSFMKYVVEYQYK